MTVLSKLPAAPLALLSAGLRAGPLAPRRLGHERKFILRPSTLSWYRLKDLLHFHFIIGASFFLAIATFVNIFYGKCELRDTPEGYEPHYWEYEKHPIPRFLMRYCVVNPQKFYEKKLARLHIECVRRQWADEEQRVKHLMFERGDYKAWFYMPMKAKWVDRNRWYFDHLRDNFESYKHIL